MYGLITAAIMWYFWSGIPLDLFESSTTFIVIVGGILTAVFATLFVSSLSGPPKEPEAPGMIAEPDNSYIGIIGAFLFGIIVFPVMLIFHESSAISSELKDYGETATGIIVDGSSLKTRRGDFSSVQIKFQTVDGKDYTVDHDVSAGQFNNFYAGQEVPVLYSSRYPTIVTINYGNQQSAADSRKEVKRIALADLLKILNFQTPGQANIHLNTVDEKWSYNIMGPNQVLFKTEANQSYLQLVKNVKLIFSTAKSKASYIAEFEKAGWKRTDEAGQTSFTLDEQYTATISGFDLTGGNANTADESSHSMTRVTIHKRNMSETN